MIHLVICDDNRDFAWRLKTELEKLLADRSNTAFRLYPKLNHVFVEAIYSDILKASKEYSVERHVGEDVIGDIAAFVSQH